MRRPVLHRKKQLPVVGQFVDHAVRRQQAAGADVKPRHRLVASHRHALEIQHRVVGGKLRGLAQHMGQHLRAHHGGVGLAGLHAKRVGVTADEAARVDRRTALALGQQAIVPARLEPGVRVDLKVPVLALVERHAQRTGPARPARLQRVQAQPAHLAVGPAGAELQALLGHGLLDDAEIQPRRIAGLGVGAAQREAEQRVAVRGHGDEDRLCGQCAPRRRWGGAGRGIGGASCASAAGAGAGAGAGAATSRADRPGRAVGFTTAGSPLRAGVPPAAGGPAARRSGRRNAAAAGWRCSVRRPVAAASAWPAGSRAARRR